MANERDDSRETLLKDLEEKVRVLLANGSKSGAIWDFLVKDPNNGYWALLNRSARSCWNSLPRSQQGIWEWYDFASQANVNLLTQKKKIQDKDFEWKPTGSLGHWLSIVVAHAVSRAKERMIRDAGMFALAAWHEENRNLSRDELRMHERHISFWAVWSKFDGQSAPRSL